MVQIGDETADFPHWNETSEGDGSLREVYRPLVQRLDAMPRGRVKALDDRLDATMREMGVTFDISRHQPWGRRPWFCDLLPQIFDASEWQTIERGVGQRLHAYECFLQDIHGAKEILRSGTLPVQPVLGSKYYQRVAAGLARMEGSFLHLCGLCLCRLPDGRVAVKHHYFSNASGISYMIQNRRALARVIPQSFGELAISSIAEVPTDILEMLRSFSKNSEPTVVLLSPGPGSAVYSEHAFLARRMGIPLVQGGDMLVLNDSVYLKTVTGLEKVEVIYTRVADEWLDPMVFRRDSMLGVPGLVNCIRCGTVSVVNAIGAQLADDRAHLPFSSRIIRFYTGQHPILPTLNTYWLGDIDQREMVLDNLEDFTVRPLYGEKILTGGEAIRPSEKHLESARREIQRHASSYIAQPQSCDALSVTYHNGHRRLQRQDHIVFALREQSGNYQVFPGALTRTTTEDSRFTSNELGGGSKDTWVEAQGSQVQERAVAREVVLPSPHVGSRVAEAFYWIGRYLERANSLAGMVRVIEALELEELNPTERTLYRPVWNKILPPLENPSGVTRRTLSSPAGRHRLTLDLEEPDSVVNAVLRAAANAESVLECLSLEAWGVLDAVRGAFRRARYRPHGEQATSTTRQMCDEVAMRVPQFFGTAEATMVSDGAWAFCEIGQRLERAIITANAVTSILELGGRLKDDDDEEIRLSAFLRLLGSRDVYRRVYQMRIERGPMLDLLWNNPQAPRSVLRCLGNCCALLHEARDAASPGTERTLAGIEILLTDLRQTDWDKMMVDNPGHACQLAGRFLSRILDLHHLISDGFLNHQILIRAESQPTLFGPKNAL